MLLESILLNSWNCIGVNVIFSQPLSCLTDFYILYMKDSTLIDLVRISFHISCPRQLMWKEIRTRSIKESVQAFSDCNSHIYIKIQIESWNLTIFFRCTDEVAQYPIDNNRHRYCTAIKVANQATKRFNSYSHWLHLARWRIRWNLN